MSGFGFRVEDEDVKKENYQKIIDLGIDITEYKNNNKCLALLCSAYPNVENIKFLLQAKSNNSMYKIDKILKDGRIKDKQKSIDKVIAAYDKWELMMNFNAARQKWSMYIVKKCGFAQDDFWS